jgi:hypothetical protein
MFKYFQLFVKWLPAITAVFSAAANAWEQHKPQIADAPKP